MNEFVAKKLAEVEAFCKTSGVIVEKAGSSFADKYGGVADILKELSAQSIASAVADEQRQVFDTKLDKTKAKLASMMELYIGDEWDNPVEVLEWCSFFTGAAAAHSALASELNEGSREQLNAMVKRFEDALQQVIGGLRSVGIERAKA